MKSKVLAQKKCMPCTRSTAKLTQDQSKTLLKQVSSWILENEKIKKKFHFKGFKEAIRFVNQMAELAEAEDHHPDFCVHYNKVEITLWTHAIGGLSENDFIMAAKIESLISTD